MYDALEYVSKNKNPLVINKNPWSHLLKIDKINVIVCRCFIKKWSIMYTFKILEELIFEDTEFYDNNNINIIDITKFTKNEVNLDDISFSQYKKIKNMYYKNIFDYISNNENHKIILYIINDHAYNHIFKHYDIPKFKKNGIKIVLWLDDLFKLSKNKLENLNKYKKKFTSKILDLCDIILTPSIKYFENIESDYLPKTVYFPYMINENILDEYNINFDKKKYKILISGEINHLVYTKRKKCVMTMNKKYYEYIERPPNKISNIHLKCTSNDNSLEGYYKKLNKYAACMMILAEYPVDYILGKCTEVYYANSLPILDYSSDIMKRLLLNPFDDYIPLLYNKNGHIDHDIKYYFKFIKDNQIRNNIIENGKAIIKKYFCMQYNKKLLVNSFLETYKPKNNLIVGLNLIYMFENISFDYFNTIILGELEKIFELCAKYDKLMIVCKDCNIISILNILFKSNIKFVNVPTRLSILTFIENNSITFIKDISDDYLYSNNINDVTVINKYIYNNLNDINDNLHTQIYIRKEIFITIYINNKKECVIAKKIAKILKKTFTIIFLSMSKYKTKKYNYSSSLIQDVYYINHSILCITFDETLCSFIKNCNCTNLLLISSKEKKLINKIYNPFSCKEIKINLSCDNIEEYEINKISYIIHYILKGTYEFTTIYDSLCKIFY